MKTEIELAREAGWVYADGDGGFEPLWRFAELVRADERNSWPAEMEAMERQVNILTDALAAKREACAQLAENLTWADNTGVASAIRARGK